MRRLWNFGISSGRRQLLLRPETGKSVGSHEDDRSLAPVMRATVRSLAGLLFFVLAVGLVLEGPSLMRFL